MSLRSTAAVFAALALVPLIIVGPVACDRVADARAHRQQAERERAADASLTTVRQQQDAALAAQRKEVDHATAQLPDQAPSARQRARACLELRRQAAAAPAAPPAC